MTEIKIEKGVPLPPRKSKYPFAEMEPGDSFFAKPNEGQSLKQLHNSIMGCARLRLFPGKKFTSRQMDGGVRVWRIDGLKDGA